MKKEVNWKALAIKRNKVLFERTKELNDTSNRFSSLKKEIYAIIDEYIKEVKWGKMGMPINPFKLKKRLNREVFGKEKSGR